MIANLQSWEARPSHEEIIGLMCTFLVLRNSCFDVCILGQGNDWCDVQVLGQGNDWFDVRVLSLQPLPRLPTRILQVQGDRKAASYTFEMIANPYALPLH